MKNNKVLVTGGCGFIGTHLCKKLTEMGKDVTVLDISVPRTGNAHEYRVVKGDIRDSILVGKLMEGVDTVYHLAAVTTFNECRDDPMKALNVNAHGTATVLQEAVRCNVSSFVFFSSASVYSGNREPVKHEGMPLAPQSIYGITKLMGEKLCEDIGLKHGLPCTSLRLFNVYGERGRGVINKFADAARKGQHIVIHGDGSQTRDYIHVDDVVQIAIAAGERRLSGVYNAGTGGRCSLLELREMMERISGVRLTVKWEPRESWDLQEIVADTGKVREILLKTIPLEEGITRLLGQHDRHRPCTKCQTQLCHPTRRTYRRLSRQAYPV